MILQMMKLISGKIFGVEALQILNYLMMGFSQNGSSHKKRLKVSSIIFVWFLTVDYVGSFRNRSMDAIKICLNFSVMSRSFE